MDDNKTWLVTVITVRVTTGYIGSDFLLPANPGTVPSVQFARALEIPGAY